MTGLWYGLWALVVLGCAALLSADYAEAAAAGHGEPLVRGELSGLADEPEEPAALLQFAPIASTVANAEDELSKSTDVDAPGNVFGSFNFGSKKDGTNLKDVPVLNVPDIEAPDYFDFLTPLKHWYHGLGDEVTIVKHPVHTLSNRIRLEESNRNCLAEASVGKCMSDHGSYGVPRLQQFSKDYYGKPNHWFNHADWMAHPNVQKQGIYNITVPGTHVSAAYAFLGEHKELGEKMSFGLLTQKEDLSEQLERGIRYFDIRVAWSFKEKRLYAAYGVLLRPLEEVLRQINVWMHLHTGEVIFLSLRLARNLGKLNANYVEPILDEMDSNATIPGQLVHNQVRTTLGGFVVTFDALRRMAGSSFNMQNPTVDALTKAGKRVMYFWEGQQVLCYDREECMKTPGWLPPTLGSTMAFGPPLGPGERAAYFEVGTGSVIDPGCIHQSWKLTKTSEPAQLMRNIETFCKGLRKSVGTQPLTQCIAPLSDLPPPGTPPILYEASVVLSLTPQDQERQQLIMSTAERGQIWQSGEAYELGSDAQHANFLLLTWLFKEGNRQLLQAPNIFTMDFFHPLLAERIIHATQGRKDCGFAMFCKETGSCWARSMINGPKDECLIEKLVVLELMWASGYLNWLWATTVVFIPFGLLLLTCCCYFLSCMCCGLHALPKPQMLPEGIGVGWAAKHPKPPTEEADAGPESSPQG